jgi:hypothetical protein
MAKPINLYQGAAPAAMAQMGQGLSEVGANIGRSLQQGYQSMGQGLAGGIGAAADAYKQYKDLQSQVKASEKAFEALQGYLPEDVKTKFNSQIQALNNASLKDKASFYEQAKSFLGSSIAQTFALQKAREEQGAAMGRTMAGEAGATERTRLGIQARAEEYGGPALQTQEGTSAPGAPFYDQGLVPPQINQVNQFGSSVKKKHFSY